MLCDNIKKARIRKGISQEEMATKIHVVRQTVSKYENGLSVPDADMLLRIAELLDVPVAELLGIGSMDKELDTESLINELDRLNTLLAEKNESEKLGSAANRKRGIILLCSFLALAAAFTFRDGLVSFILPSVFLLFALVVLYRNLSLLTSITTENLKIGMLKSATIFDIIVLILVAAFIVLSKAEIIAALSNYEEMFAVGITVCIILVLGIICPKLPFTRHTGLRLPWTVQDEDTWNIAHRAIGFISPPTVLFYIAALLIFKNVTVVSIVVIISWVAIPSVASLIFFLRKYYGSHKR